MTTDTGTSIDDLLGGDDEAEETPATRSGRRRARLGRWVRTGLSAAGLTAVTVVGLRLFSLGVAVAVVFAGWLALLLLRRTTGQLAPPPRRQTHPARTRDPEDGRYDFAARDALRGAGGVLGEWEDRLLRAQRESGRYARDLHPALCELADERLRQRHGLTRAAEPERARELLGEPLWRFLDQPAKRPPAPRDLAAIVAQLENL